MRRHHYKLKVMKKIAFILLAFVACYLTTNAQKTRFGFSAGTVSGRYHLKVDGETYNSNSKAGFTAGVMAEIHLNKYFGFQPSLNMIQKSTIKEFHSSLDGPNFKLTVNCLEVPLNLTFNRQGKSGNFFVGAGPSFSIGILGKLESYGWIHNVSNIKFGSGKDDDLKWLDMGVNFMIGYCFKNGLLISVNYNAGLTNLDPEGSNDDIMKSRYFGIRLGYLLKGVSKK